jgi:hypothetical protein
MNNNSDNDLGIIPTELAAKASLGAENKASRRIPMLGIVLFSLLALKVFFPDVLNFKRKKSYHFKTSTLGFFISDLTVFQNHSTIEAEERIVAAFPDALKPNVDKVIRPVLGLCEKHDVDPFWVLSVLWTESHFRYNVTSNKGARGLMQVMPETHAHLISEMKHKGIQLESDRGQDWLSAQYPALYKEIGYSALVTKLKNLEIGIYYLSTLLNRFDGNHFHATVAYNMGPSWTSLRLKNNQPVGVKNHYLKKVMNAYMHITKNLSHNSNVSFVTQTP